MTPTDLLTTCSQLGVELAADGGMLRYRAPRGTLTPNLREALKVHKADVLKLLTAPEPDYLSETPCPICGSPERWTWLDGRALCRVCLILDLAPMTLLRQGWPDRLRPPRAADNEPGMEEGIDG